MAFYNIQNSVFAKMKEMALISETLDFKMFRGIISLDLRRAVLHLRGLHFTPQFSAVLK